MVLSNQSVPVQKMKKPSVAAKKPPDKTTQVKKPEPLYHLLGKERVKFIASARALSEVLHRTYGDEMSITKFSRILVELQGQTALSHLIDLDEKILALFSAYVDSKHKMIEEQKLFKSSYSTPPLEVAVPLTKQQLFRAESESTPAMLAGPEPIGSGPQEHLRR